MKTTYQRYKARYDEYDKQRYQSRKEQGLCVHCGGEKTTEKTTCEKCLLQNSVTERRRTATRRKLGLCKQCGKRSKRVLCPRCYKLHRKAYQKKVVSGKCNCGNKRDSWQIACKQCREKDNARKVIQRQKLKDEVIGHYGGKCACCGETEMAFLTIDHINNDGASHRRSLGVLAINYRWYKKSGYPDGFQVLCMNCNWAKRGGKTCPHKLHI